MRHAFLIMTASVDEPLLEIIRQLDSPNHDFFIHVDLKAGGINQEKVIETAKFSDVVFVDRQKGSWGGYSLIQIEIKLLKSATTRDYDYYHLMSGEDFPVKTNQELDDFFLKNRGLNFLEVSDRLEHQNPDRYRLRYEQYHFLQDRFIGKKRNVFKYIDFLSCYIQRYVGVNRARNLLVQSGSQWFSITDELAKYIVSHVNWIDKHFKYTYCCDELFIQSLIAGTQFMDKVSSNLRYVDFVWKSKHNLTPRYLTDKDLSLINDSHYLFARKFDVSSMRNFKSHLDKLRK